jgi:membrane fusion protein, multidrug efflux system
VHVDFTVAQQVAAGLREGDSVEVSAAGQSSLTVAKIVAVDARIDPTTRNATVRARIEGAANAPSPGSSVRVRVPVGSSRKAVAIPASALRKGPGGDQVFVIELDKSGKTRAHVRQVESGAMLGDEVVIHAGLSAGERVAVSGSFKLREAALVSIAGSPEDGSGSGQVIVGER